MVTAAMNAMMSYSPTKKTMLKVTKFTMTTVLHLDFQNDRSCFPFSTVQIAFIHGVLGSSQCFCLLLDSVALPCIDAFPQELQNFSCFQRKLLVVHSVQIDFSKTFPDMPNEFRVSGCRQESRPSIPRGLGTLIS